MFRMRPLVPLLCLSVLLLAGCDAHRGASFRFEVQDGRSGTSVAGALVRIFWFEDPEDALGQGPVEACVKKAGEERSHRASYGLTQVKWHETRTDDSGTALLGCSTFYAGAYLLPLSDLVFGAREEDPTGLWIRVHPGGEPSMPYQDFLIMDGDDGPTPVRIRWEGRHPPEEGRPAGAVHRIQGEKRRPKYCWRVVIPVER